MADKEGENIKNLLIIGCPKSGKSTLADVLIDTTEFGENNKMPQFEWNGKKYRVVDTNFSVDRPLNEIVEEISRSMPEGISQVLFVFSKRFTAEEVETYKLFEKAIDRSGITKYITIVRTNFNNFKDEGEREKDRKKLTEENELIAKILESHGGIIHVDNPPINISGGDYGETEININKRRREDSRNILLEHLDNVCQEKYFKWIEPEIKIKLLQNILDIISNFIHSLFQNRKDKIIICRPNGGKSILANV